MIILNIVLKELFIMIRIPYYPNILIILALQLSLSIFQVTPIDIHTSSTWQKEQGIYAFAADKASFSKENCHTSKNNTLSNCEGDAPSNSSITELGKQNIASDEKATNSTSCNDDGRSTLHSPQCDMPMSSTKASTLAAGARHGIIDLSTDKDSYKKGEGISIILSNNGNHSLVFSKASSDNIEIRNLAANATYHPTATFGTGILQPGANKTFFWNQQGENNNQVNSGHYTVTVSKGAFKVNTTFTITQ